MEDHHDLSPDELRWELIDADLAAKAKATQPYTGIIQWRRRPWYAAHDRALYGAHPVWVFSDELTADNFDHKEAERFAACGCWHEVPEDEVVKRKRTNAIAKAADAKPKPTRKRKRCRSPSISSSDSDW